MELRPASGVAARPGAPAYFSGRVWIEVLAETDHVGVTVFRVNFEPGARTAWHVHGAGQTLVVTSGRGAVQKRGEARQSMVAGDVVVIAPGEEHWHGADPDCPMQHLAIQGRETTWLELVDDAV